MIRSAAKAFFPLLMLAVTFAATGCSQSGPASIAESSAARADLADRVQFIERYVKFRRQYVKLDYAVTYQNNGGGMVPAPSDWDIRLLAVVPKAEVNSWIPSGVAKKQEHSPHWLRDLPGSIQRQGITEWYRQSGTEVGIDRSRSVIAYRNTTTPDSK